MNFFFNPYFLSVSLGHFFVDSLNAQRSLLLTYLSQPLGLTNSMIGLVSTIYIFVGGLIQPFFGYLSDRRGVRWVAAGGVIWMMVFYSLALIIPGRQALIYLVIASLGSGAVHPAGTAQATRIGRDILAGKETTVASYFSLFGAFGYFLGPLLGGFMLDTWSMKGLLLLPLLGLPIFVFMASIRDMEYTPIEVEKTVGRKFGVSSWSLLSILIVVASCQSWCQTNISTFLPKYLSDMGEPASFYGLMLALFSAGSAIGNLVGSPLSDRYGHRWVMVGGLMCGSLPLALLAMTGVSPWLYILVPLSSILTGSVFSSLVILSQRVIPGGMGLASGLALGFLFASGALGVLVSGALADAFGFVPVFLLSSALALLGGLTALRLKNT